MQDMGAGAREMVHNLGIRLVRHSLYWDRMEPTDKPGVYDSKYLDKWTDLIATCQKQGICLEVVIEVSAPSAGKDHARTYQRLADFAADMAKRFPSVVYWQLFDKADAAALLGAKDNLSSRELGKCYGQLLKLAYPAIKAANPAAWMPTAGISDKEFLQGLYDAGAAGYFDILNARTGALQSASSLEDLGKRFRAIMAPYNDETKPLWGTCFESASVSDAKVFDGKQLEDLRSCLEANNTSRLYQKIIACQLQTASGNGVDFGLVRRDMTVRPAYTWARQADQQGRSYRYQDHIRCVCADRDSHGARRLRLQADQ